MASVMMVMIFAFAAFSVDVGFIALTKAQMQTAADSASLGAAHELLQYQIATIESGTPYSPTYAEQLARDVATDLAAEHSNGNSNSTLLSANDIVLGNRAWDESSQSWQTTWGVSPYNVVEVTVKRDAGQNNKLPLFFAPVIGHSEADVVVSAEAAYRAGVGFRTGTGPSGGPKVIPFAIDLDSWSRLLEATEPDQYKYNKGTGTVTLAADNMAEINIYPKKDGTLPSGNLGTVNLGAPNNSTADIERQILYGLSAEDLSYFPNNELSVENGPIEVTGDPGLSAALQTPLEQIIGDVRAFPLFTYVEGNGANATYQIVKFVGGRIMAVKLTGSFQSKHLIIQPAQLQHNTVIPGKFAGGVDALWASPGLSK